MELFMLRVVAAGMLGAQMEQQTGATVETLKLGM
jgi:hypothetical protein